MPTSSPVTWSSSTRRSATSACTSATGRWCTQERPGTSSRSSTWRTCRASTRPAGSPDGVGGPRPGPAVGAPRASPAGSGRGDDPDRGAGEEGGNVLDGLAVEDLVGATGDVAQVRGEDGAAQLPQGVVRRQRLLVVDVDAGPGDPVVPEHVDERGLLDDRPATGVHEDCGVLHQGEVVCADEAAGPPGPQQVDGHDVRGGEQLVLLDATDADLGGALVGEVLAPGDDVHAEGDADAGDLGTEPAESDDAESPAREVAADGLLPATDAHGGVLLRDVAEGREDEAPGELGGGGRLRAGAADGDAQLGGGFDVDRLVPHAGGDEQLEVGQPFEDLAPEGGALAHRDDDVEDLEAGHEGVRVGDVVVELDHLDLLRDLRPVAVVGGDALVVVQDGDAMHTCWCTGFRRLDALRPPPARCGQGPWVCGAVSSRGCGRHLCCRHAACSGSPRSSA